MLGGDLLAALGAGRTLRVRSTVRVPVAVAVMEAFVVTSVGVEPEVCWWYMP